MNSFGILNNTNFYGTISQKLGNWQNITNIAIFNSNGKGTIPHDWYNAFNRNFEYFILGQNEFTGIIPNDINITNYKQHDERGAE